MDGFDLTLVILSFVVTFFFLVGITDIICMLVQWRWSVVKRNSARRAYLKSSRKRPTNALNEKTAEIIVVRTLTEEEMSRYYGAPW